ncbi:MAG: hypothetical protein CR997_00440 [Acidobacteria bacterium]|nr:MAG: hypothetical protein CR997_00440 [Acidobacteriota bacterium]
MSLQYIIKDQNGASRDFESLYEEWFPDIFNYHLHCVGSVADAEDLTAHTFLKAMKNLWKYRWSRGSFSSWLYRIAHNEMKSFFRKKQRLRLFNSTPILQVAPFKDEIEEAERVRTRDRFYVSLQKSLAELSPEDNSLLVLRFFQAKSYEELASIFKIRKGTLAMRIHRALKRLRKIMDKEGLCNEEFRKCFENLSEA